MALAGKITVEVEYLGFAAGLAGKKEELLSLEDEYSLQDLLQSILNSCLPLSGVSSSLIVAVNRRVVRPDGKKISLVDGDRVSVGLKISGG
jgi:molybdopterin converting factor small subunit